MADTEKSKGAVISIRLKKMAINAQTTLFAVGVALPAFLLWAGSYLMFTFPTLLVQVETFLKNFTAEQIPAIYSGVLLPLNANNGVAYTIIGLASFLLAIVIARFTANRLNLSELKLGEVRVRSLLMAMIVAFVVVAIVISLANKVLFDPLLALQSA